MFKHAMEFFKHHANLKKSLPRHCFINFLKDLSNRNCITLFELLKTKIGKPKKILYATLGMWAWVPQHE
jgi:hypothetical protein